MPLWVAFSFSSLDFDQVKGMMKIAVLLFILMVAVPVSFRCWQRWTARGRSKRGGITAPAKPAFSAVTVKVGLDCCQAAQEISSEVFLSKNAPQLPVPQCDAVSCGCRYASMKDRREGERRSPVLALQERFTTPEQWANRGVRGRRKDDVDEARRAQQAFKAAMNQH